MSAMKKNGGSPTGSGRKHNFNIEQEAESFNIDQNFQSFLNVLLDKALFTVTIFGGIAVAGTLLDSFKPGFQSIFLYYLASYLFIVFLLIKKDKIAFKVKARFLTSIFFLSAVSSVVKFGAVGLSPVTFIIFCILSTLFFNLRGGLTAVFISTLSYSAVGLLFVNGYLTYDFDVSSYVTALSPWLLSFLGYSFMALVIVYMLGIIQSFLLSTNLRLQNEVDTRLKAEKKANESEENYRKLVEDINVIVWNAIPDPLRFTFVSKEAEKLLGYSTEHWLADPQFWEKHIYEEDRDAALNYCLSATEKLRDHEFEYRMLTLCIQLDNAGI